MEMSKTRAIKVAKDPENQTVNDVIAAARTLRTELYRSDISWKNLARREKELEAEVKSFQETTIAQERDALQAQVKKLEASVGPLRDAMSKKKLQAVTDIDQLPAHVKKVIESLLNLPGLGQLYICKACGGIYQDGYVCSCSHDNSADQRHYKQWAAPLLAVDSFIDYEEE